MDTGQLGTHGRPVLSVTMQGGVEKVVPFIVVINVLCGDRMAPGAVATYDFFHTRPSPEDIQSHRDEVRLKSGTIFSLYHPATLN